MRQEKAYPKRQGKARLTFYAVNGGRRVRIQGATMEAALTRLRELCPGGTFRELWGGRTC